MAEWRKAKIGELCKSVSETYNGTASKVVLVNTSDVLEGKVLNHELVDNKDLKGQFKKNFQYEDILYSEIRPANKRFAFIDFSQTANYIASTKLMVIRANKERIRPRFLFAILKSASVLKELQILAETRSGTFPQITFGAEVAPMEIDLPDFETQDKIISVLTAIEEKIERNTEINNNLAERGRVRSSFFYALNSRQRTGRIAKYKE